MKINVRISILLLIPILLAIILFSFIVTSFVSPIIHQYLLNKPFFANLFIHLLFNFILLAIIAKECLRSQSSNKQDNTFSSLICFAYEMEEHGETLSNDDAADNFYMDDDQEGDDNDEDDELDDDDDDRDDYYHGSDGYDEDDDDNGSDGEIGWEEEDEEEEYDSELEKRIEAFIAKVINGWKEEWFTDNMNN